LPPMEHLRRIVEKTNGPANIGHAEAGQRSAVIYSVLGSCRRLGINPAEYLQDVFERLPKAKTSEVKSLTPAAWLSAKRKAARQS